jgi:hypothetical protein
MTKQIELFNPLEFIDLTHGMTPRSTRRKQPKHRKTIALLQSNDRPSVHKSNKSRT